MTAPVVNTLPAAPSRNDSPGTFVETADIWVAALSPWTTSVNALGSWMDSTASAVNTNAGIASSAASTAQTAAANAVNAPGTSATSSTTLTPSIASKSLTIQTGKSFSVGQFVVIADTANPTTNYMIGNITSYNSGTGALVVNVTNSAGSSASAWTISLTGAPAQNSLSNDLTFLGTGRRIFGDLSNVTTSDRLSFQSSTLNGNSGVLAIPNGTGTQASFGAFNSSNPNNASSTYIATTSAESQLVAAKTGTGNYLPLTFYTNGSEKFRITTDGRFQADFSNATVANRLLFQSSTANNPTSIGAIPNGTNPYASFTAFASSNPDQSALIQIATTNTETMINSTRTGSASYLPLSFYTGGARRLLIDTSGNLIQFNSAGSDIVYTARATDASASTARAFYSNLQNENTVAVTTIEQYAQPDGGSLIDFYTTAAGSRAADRRVAHWRINSNGYLQNISNTMTSFSASSLNKMTGEGNSTMVFGIIGHNTGNAYDSSTGSFTAPVTGFYQFSFNCYLVRATLGVANHTFVLQKNGSRVNGSYSATRIGDTGSAITTYGSASFCVPLYLTAGDVVTVYHGGNAWASDGSGNITEAGFHGMLLR